MHREEAETCSPSSPRAWCHPDLTIPRLELARLVAGHADQRMPALSQRHLLKHCAALGTFNYTSNVGPPLSELDNNQK